VEASQSLPANHLTVATVTPMTVTHVAALLEDAFGSAVEVSTAVPVTRMPADLRMAA
jgi:hypothetical protein